MTKLTLDQAIDKVLPQLRRRRQLELEAALKSEETEDARAAMAECMELSRTDKVRQRQERNEEKHWQGAFRVDVEKFRMLTGSDEDSPLFWAAFSRWIVKRGLRHLPPETESPLMQGFEDGSDDFTRGEF